MRVTIAAIVAVFVITGCAPLETKESVSGGNIFSKVSSKIGGLTNAPPPRAGCTVVVVKATAIRPQANSGKSRDVERILRSSPCVSVLSTSAKRVELTYRTEKVTVTPTSKLADGALKLGATILLGPVGLLASSLMDTSERPPVCRVTLVWGDTQASGEAPCAKYEQSAYKLAAKNALSALVDSVVADQ